MRGNRGGRCVRALNQSARNSQRGGPAAVGTVFAVGRDGLNPATRATSGRREASRRGSRESRRSPWPRGVCSARNPDRNQPRPAGRTPGRSLSPLTPGRDLPRSAIAALLDRPRTHDPHLLRQTASGDANGDDPRCRQRSGGRRVATIASDPLVGWPGPARHPEQGSYPAQTPAVNHPIPSSRNFSQSRSHPNEGPVPSPSIRPVEPSPRCPFPNTWPFARLTCLGQLWYFLPGEARRGGLDLILPLTARLFPRTQPGARHANNPA